MTRKLEELFDLASSASADSGDTLTTTQPDLAIIPESLDQLDKIEAALPAVRGLEATDKEMDELAQNASDSYKDLMDLGMQVDSRFASEIFSVASQMLGHAITAKNAKVMKKLKIIDLQLKKLKLDRDAANASGTPTPTAEGQVLDRNALLERVLGKNQNTQKE
jgi:hypothetical protein